jgi:ABC-type transport system involved in cytochrome bd biosynthesis fused ATPase/permease subunit
MPAIAISLVGSVGIAWFRPLSGLFTFFATLILILLIPRIGSSSRDAIVVNLDQSRKVLAKKFETMSSRRLEGQIFGYSSRLSEEATRTNSELSSIQVELDKTEVRTALLVYSWMAGTIIINAVFVTFITSSESPNLIEIALPILLPIVIFDLLQRFTSRP